MAWDDVVRADTWWQNHHPNDDVPEEQMRDYYDLVIVPYDAFLNNEQDIGTVKHFMIKYAMDWEDFSRDEAIAEARSVYGETE